VRFFFFFLREKANECKRKSVKIGLALFIGGRPGELVLKTVFYRLSQVIKPVNQCFFKDHFCNFNCPTI
jgi:hypothetical protein